MSQETIQPNPAENEGLTPEQHQAASEAQQSLVIAAQGIHMISAEDGYRNNDSVIVKLPEGDARYKIVAEEKPKEFDDEHIGRPSGPQTGSTELLTRKIYEDQMTLARRPGAPEHKGNSASQ